MWFYFIRKKSGESKDNGWLDYQCTSSTAESICMKDISAGWVKTFSVKYGNGTGQWGHVDHGREFDGNVNHWEKKHVYFQERVLAQRIRLFPYTWESYPQLRCGLIFDDWAQTQNQPQACKVCPYGQYQPLSGQVSCKQIPPIMAEDMDMVVDEEDASIPFSALQFE